MLIKKFVNFITDIDPSFEPKIILDIGSRDLEQSIEFYSVYPKSKIFAFEPNPEQFNICLEKSKQFSNITVFQNAVSLHNETLDFYVTPGNIGASSLLEPIDIPFSTSHQIIKIKVQSIKLKDWLEQNNISEIDIMWLDTQGLELEVLKSLEEKITKVKFIHCEAAEMPYYKGHNLKNELENYLKDNKFNFTFYIDNPHPYNEGDILAYNENYFPSR